LEGKLKDYDAMKDRFGDLEDKLAGLQGVLGDRDPRDLENELELMKAKADSVDKLFKGIDPDDLEDELRRLRE